MAFSPKLSDIVIDVGGDTLLRYGTLTRRLAPPTRGGEQLIETVTRASVGGSITPQGTFLPVQAGTPKVTWIKDANGLYQPRLLLEAAATNKLTAPEDLSNGAWTKTRVTIPSTNNTSPRGDATASFLREDASVSATHSVDQTFTVAVAAQKVGATVFLKPNGRTWAILQISDFVANGFGVEVNLSGAGSIATAGLSGAGAVTFSQLVALANGWWMVTLYGTVGAGAVTTPHFVINLETGSGVSSYTGDGASGMYVWGCVATDNQIAGMYWGTGASRASEVFTLPYSYKPQLAWRYSKFYELDKSGVSGRAICFVGPANAGEIWGLDRTVNGYRTNRGAVSAITGGLLGAYTDLVETLELCNADGSVALRVSINGAADVTAGPSAPSAFGTAFTQQLFALSGFSGGLSDSYAALARVLVGLNSLPSSIADVRTVLAGLPAA